VTTTPPPARPALSPPAVEALLLDTTPWLSCDDCFEQMDTYVEAALRQEDPLDVAMTRHLEGCVACHEEAESLMALLESDALR
jgi:hypothetical protein